MTKAKTATAALPDNKVSAQPTKDFFVHMLVRDIPLIDAIMDLIDNCVDGIHRIKGNDKKRGMENDGYFYKGFHAELTVNGNEFILKDNCGGIPETVAKHYAFRLGRPDDYNMDKKLETLGMYGIGMKRAIFKMGSKADVISWNKQDFFKVNIPTDWTSQPGWTFDFQRLNKAAIAAAGLKVAGTVVKISGLHKPISANFKDKALFLQDLAENLRSHYGYIISQGFSLSLNGNKIFPMEINILTVPKTVTKKMDIRPYVFTDKIEGVDVDIVIGFYRPFPTQDEIDSELNGQYAASSSGLAGITVICNDRIVLPYDKTFLTGWGETPVPKYHTQFISIGGVAHFRSSEPIKLPVTTTKRNLDTSSTVYAEAKNKIKQGLKIFTLFTNNWKSNTPERRALFSSTQKINVLKPQPSNSKLVTLTKRGKETGQFQIPTLPVPESKRRDHLVNINFSKEKNKVQEMKDHFSALKNKSASEIGSWCFDKMHSQIE